MSNIYIETSAPFFYTGTKIEGSIFLQLNTILFPNKLILKFKVSEQCEWLESTVKNNPQSLDKKCDDFKSLYRKLFILKKWKHDGKLFKGGYHFNFEFFLKENLPSSFNFRKLHFAGMIRYKLKVQLITLNNTNNLKNHILLDIYNRKDALEKIFFSKKIISKCFCCLKKYFKLSVTAKNDYFIKSDHLELEIKLENFSNSMFFLKLDVMQKIIFRGQYGEVLTQINTLFSQTYNNISKEVEQIFSLIWEIKENQDISIPSSCKGSIIECQYFLKVSGEKFEESIPFQIFENDHKINVNLNKENFVFMETFRLKLEEGKDYGEDETNDTDAITHNSIPLHLGELNVVQKKKYPWLPYENHWDNL